jgi:hypothetical protein
LIFKSSFASVVFSFFVISKFAMFGLSSCAKIRLTKDK